MIDRQPVRSEGDEPLRRGDRLPSVVLSASAEGGRCNLRPSRGPRVVVTIHGPACGACVDYLEQLARSRGAIADWGGDVVAVAPHRVDGSALPELGVPLLEDPDGRIAMGDPRVLAADEWGELFFVGDAGADHGFITAEEAVDWIRFIAIQCPECEGPEGEWRNL